MSEREAIEAKGPAAYLTEFVGTTMLVLAITGYVAASSVTSLDLLSLAVVHGLVLMAIVYSIGSISGAHVNPAVTLALLAIKKILPRDAGIYVLMQALGGILGAWLARTFFLGRGSLVNYGAPGIDELYLQGGKVWLAFLAEAIGAFILVWAVMGTAVNPNAPKGVAGAAIGGALALGVLIFGPATGASFNPARWLGPALVSGTWDDAWLYILAPIVGAVGAAFAYLAVMQLAAPALPAQSPAARRVGRAARSDRVKLPVRLLGRLVLVLILDACALVALDALLPGITIDGLWAALALAVTIGIGNAIVWPLLVRIALPFTVATLGLGALRSTPRSCSAPTRCSTRSRSTAGSTRCSSCSGCPR